MSTATPEQDHRTDSPIDGVRYIPLFFDTAHAEDSALKLVQAYAPEWILNTAHIQFVPFTEGITNTLYKATIELPDRSRAEIDQNAILLRAYGNGTEILIDRQRELKAHTLLASRGLAPPLLARFENGLMYRFVSGDVCSPEDLRKPEVYREVAARLGEWHGSLPISPISTYPSLNGRTPGQKSSQPAPTIPIPNIWTVTASWIAALPSTTPSDASRQSTLSTELSYLRTRFEQTPGLFSRPYIFAHCDLLSGNVIRQQPSSDTLTTTRPVNFIDYEYATPAPAAFDLANHFAEWGGFACEYSALPTRSARNDFLHHYTLAFYDAVLEANSNVAVEIDFRAAREQLEEQVNAMRGLPGFYWGVWALIQQGISEIGFDYKSYAEKRLGEYWDWREAEREGKAAGRGAREKRWAEE
ncbi:hypothetical protein B0A48_08002 [Cryoendolithus antarcticus]|uniref:ethanolamine kinase n=1 Tax=Cryoendolithus antarcticus TaxID=1507870 RepID=A0A1V8T0X9_9PEZI|nr:hypothetical protein B0A48_08002 [Cryoendolithus antarcticus]